MAGAALTLEQARLGDDTPWIVCQIGAREHYAIAAELHRRGRLMALCTDIWASAGSMWHAAALLVGASGRTILDRFEPALSDAKVITESPAALAAKVVPDIASGTRDQWWRIMAANRRFGEVMAWKLEKAGLLMPKDQPLPAVFAYSYAAREILSAAKRAGCPTVLGQIDPGPQENRIVAEIASRHGLGQAVPAPPPASYWESWQVECALADAIVVNSAWSAELLERAGIAPKKIHVVPLAYRREGSGRIEAVAHSYSTAFSAKRPLLLLFLGQICYRKGVLELIEAMRCLGDAPVRLLMAGPASPGFVQLIDSPPNIEWIGRTARSDVVRHYQRADLFILPTHSDGFAITQLEAMAHGLPVIASRHCGGVVRHGVNGWLLDEVTPAAIAARLRSVIAEPGLLPGMALRARERAADFSPDRIVTMLIEQISNALS